jgi:hypothetical protein
MKSTWARWWRSWLPQVGPPFLIVLARWRQVDCSPILHYGWATLRHIFTSPLSPQWTASFKHVIASWCSTWTCTTQPWWRSPLDVILHGLYEIFLLTQSHGDIPNPTKNSHKDHGLVHKAQWTMLTIPWDHLIPLGTSSMLCVISSLFIKMMSWRYTWVFTQSSSSRHASNKLNTH